MLTASTLSASKPSWLSRLDPTFYLEPVGHNYWLDNKRIPGCTGMLKDQGYIDVEWCKPSARLRGSEVHKGIHYLNEGDLHWDSVPRAYRGYLEAYQRFFQDWNVIPELVEVPIYHPVYRYGVTADIVGRVLDNVPAIIEIKTGPIKKWVPLQTIAQEMAVRAWEPGAPHRRRWGVRLNEDGTYKPSPEFVNYDRDEAQFRIILGAVQGRDLYGD